MIYRDIKSRFTKQGPWNEGHLCELMKKKKRILQRKDSLGSSTLWVSFHQPFENKKGIICYRAPIVLFNSSGFQLTMGMLEMTSK